MPRVPPARPLAPLALVRPASGIPTRPATDLSPPLPLLVDRSDEGEWRLYSIDHGKFYVPDVGVSADQEHPVRKLAACIPHALLLRTANAQYAVVVPNVLPVRPPIGDQPFTTELVLDRLAKPWRQHLSTSYFTFGVHVSGAFLQPPSLGSALYLLLLRLQAR